MPRIDRFTLKSALAAFVAASLLFIAPTSSRAQSTPAPCILGYTIGFFNGVWNTEVDAVDGLNALQQSVEQATGNTDDTYNNEQISYQLFYNHTGSSTGATGLEDIAEVFIQRANEIDPSGYFSGNNFYLFWDSITSTPTFTTALTSTSSALSAFFSDFTNSMVTSAAATLASLVSSPPTASDYATQNATLDTLAAAGRKFVLIAHSQGNLFVNQAYDHIMPVIGATRVKVVHVAPASPTIRGNYILSGNDLIINGLRLDGGVASVQPNNINIPFSSGDASGHTLVGTYLDQTRNGYAATTALFTGALSALVKGSCNVTISPTAGNTSPGGSTTFTATLASPPAGAVLAIGYSWTITGNAGGTFTGSSGNVTTITTTANSIAYNAASNAAMGEIDTITVTAYATKTDGSLVSAEQLGTAAATASIKSLDRSLYGGPGGYDCGSTALPGPINNDDSLTIYLNGAQVYYSPGAYCGGPTSIPLPGAKKGDTVRIVIADEHGHHSGISSIYMYNGSTYVMVVPGFNRDTPDGQNNGVQLDTSFTIPF